MAVKDIKTPAQRQEAGADRKKIKMERGKTLSMATLERRLKVLERILLKV
tara:strand:+ start:450 stop:599 length:150 start_codon:yes stop_codon:yes gene_type:complete